AGCFPVCLPTATVPPSRYNKRGSRGLFAHAHRPGPGRVARRIAPHHYTGLPHRDISAARGAAASLARAGAKPEVQVDCAERRAAPTEEAMRADSKKARGPADEQPAAAWPLAPDRHACGL